VNVSFSPKRERERERRTLGSSPLAFTAARVKPSFSSENRAPENAERRR